MILSKDKDLRLVTLRRGGLLVDEDHRRLALWAALCVEHVFHLFERRIPGDDRPRAAVAATRAWAAGEIRTTEAKVAAYYAIRAVMEAAEEGAAPARAREERAWQRSFLPEEIRDLVLEDSLRRDSLCWGVFSL